MSQFKTTLMKILKLKADKGTFTIEEIEMKLKEEGQILTRATLMASMRTINNNLVPAGFFLNRESNLGRGSTAAYSVTSQKVKLK